MGKLCITIAGAAFAHILYHFVLAFSRWEHVEVVDVSADPNLPFFGRCECACSSSCVFFRSASLTRLLPS
jgi:hypothetical protein